MTNIKHIIVGLGLLMPGGLQVHGQSTGVRLQELLSSTATLKEWKVYDTALLHLFYASHQETLYWLNPQRTRERQRVRQLLDQAGAFGLNKSDYHYPELLALQENGGKEWSTMDSVHADVLYTDGVLRLISDISYGRTPAFHYNGLKSVPDKQALLQWLQKFVVAPDASAVLAAIEPATKAYKAMKTLLATYESTLQEPAFTEVRVTSTKADTTNKPLLLRLSQLDLLDSAKVVTGKEVVASLKQAQLLLDLQADGKLGNLTLKALNIPLGQRVAALRKALNDLRWLHRFQGDSIAVVNLPSTSLYVYAQEMLIHESRLVVGKKSTPTPTLSSSIHEVILYPYWTVPHSIATKELLPHIKRNTGYLAANNFQVLNRQGKVVDPTVIDWQRVNAANFPYTIRQSTGCDNSLGIVKFNFHNPFSVYLHDTPSKGLFSLRKRFFSHGCMRVENPLAFAELLLQKERESVKRLTNQCLRDQKPTVFRLKKPLPVAVLYNTAWYDTKGNVYFYDDVYGK